MKATFQNTVDILVKAYLNDTLQHGNCYACAVGNIVADGLKCKVVKAPDGLKWSNGMPYPAWCYTKPDGWGAAFTTDNGNDYNSTNDPNEVTSVTDFIVLQNPIVRNQIEATGYTAEDLFKIEFAFEAAYKGRNPEDWMFNGLMAVVDVLAEIHGIDLTQKEVAKSLFVKV